MDLSFEKETHTYRIGGQVWPSVTQVLDPLQQLDGIPADVLAAAAAFGTNVHAACHLDNLGELDEATLDTALLPYLTAWRKFQSDVGLVILASEKRVMHGGLRYAGTLDVVGLVRDARELIDIKSTAAIPRTAGPQTAAYAEALGEPRIRRRVVQLRSDGTYRTERLTDRGDFNLFISALNLWNWRHRNAK